MGLRQHAGHLRRHRADRRRVHRRPRHEWQQRSFATGLSGGGGLTKAGSGVLTLIGSNSYGGATTISAGVLAVGASNMLSQQSAMNVGTNGTAGTLNVTGYSQNVNNLTIGANGYLRIDATHPLTTQNLTFNAGSTINIIGAITSTPDLLMTYSGTQPTPFTYLYNNGGSLPSGDSLQYSGGSVEVVNTPPATSTTYSLIAATATPTIHVSSATHGEQQPGDHHDYEYRIGGSGHVELHRTGCWQQPVQPLLADRPKTA